MAEVKWIKIVTDVFNDEKILLIESLPEADSIIVIWFKLLCLAGIQNNSGVFVMSNGIPYTESMLATIFRRKESTVSLALKTFEQFGMIEVINGTVTIPNWNKHQTLDSYEKKKERDRLYQAKRREEQRLIAESSDKSSDVAVSEEDIEEDIDNIYSSEVATAPADKVRVSFEKDSRPYKCALYLARQISERIPGKKYAEATLQSWAKDFDRVNRLDGHSWDDIGTVLTFSQNDSFWQGNILSGAKFRKQYDQLYLKMQKEDA